VIRTAPESMAASRIKQTASTRSLTPTTNFAGRAQPANAPMEDFT
jgi:hypothetical protein